MKSFIILYYYCWLILMNFVVLYATILHFFERNTFTVLLLLFLLRMTHFVRLAIIHAETVVSDISDSRCCFVFPETRAGVCFCSSLLKARAMSAVHTMDMPRVRSGIPLERGRCLQCIRWICLVIEAAFRHATITNQRCHDIDMHTCFANAVAAHWVDVPCRVRWN